MAVDEERFRQGLAIREKLGMPTRPFPNTDHDFYAMTIAQLFGTVFARPGLALRDRELVTLAAIIAIGGTHENLFTHFRALRALGFGEPQVEQVIEQAARFCGEQRGGNARASYRRVKAEAPGLAAAPASDGQTAGVSETNSRENEMIALAVVVALGGTPEQLAERFAAAKAAGCDESEIKEIIVQTMYYSGWPRGAAANQVFNRWKRDAAAE